MKITPVTTKKALLLPAVLTGSAAMISCQQQTGGQVSPGAPPPSFTADVAAASTGCSLPAAAKPVNTNRQRLAGKKPAQ